MDPRSEPNRHTVSMKCRILGVHATDRLEDIKAARDRLASIFHPDKHPELGTKEIKALEERFEIIQDAYEFLKTHYEAIQKAYFYAKENTLTSKENRRERSHWVYTSISKYKE